LQHACGCSVDVHQPPHAEDHAADDARLGCALRGGPHPSSLWPSSTGVWEFVRDGDQECVRDTGQERWCTLWCSCESRRYSGCGMSAALLYRPLSAFAEPRVPSVPRLVAPSLACTGTNSRDAPLPRQRQRQRPSHPAHTAEYTTPCTSCAHSSALAKPHTALSASPPSGATRRWPVYQTTVLIYYFRTTKSILCRHTH